MLADNSWALAELADAAAASCIITGHALGLPQMHALADWLDRQDMAPPASQHERVLIVDVALAQAPAALLGDLPAAARRALATAMVDLIDALSWAQGDAVAVLSRLVAAQSFAEKELLIARAVATVLEAVSGPSQRALQVLAASSQCQRPVVLLALDRASLPRMRAVAKNWLGPVTVLVPDMNSLDLPLSIRMDLPPWRLAQLADQIEIISAPNLESHADAAARRVLGILHANSAACISLVALDRRAARRVRALLQRADVQVADAAGWRMSTTAASACLMRWLDMAQEQRAADLLDFAKLPWVAQSTLGLQADALAWFESFVRQRALTADFERIEARLRAIGNRSDVAYQRQLTLVWLDQLRRRLATMHGNATIGGHVQRIQSALEPVLAQAMCDAAGLQLVTCLERLGRDPAPQLITLAAFVAVLDAQLESESFALPTGKAQVRILPLGVAAWRAADHVIVLGAQTGLWPLPRPAARVLSWAQQEQLGLAGHDDGMDAARILLARGVPLTCIHTRSSNEARFDASPWLEQLRILAARRGISMPVRDWQPTHAQVLTRPSQMPSPDTPVGLLPPRLSVSALEALLACPYKFFALRLLGLQGLDTLDDTPDARDFGVLAHAWLHGLHEAGLLGQPASERTIAQASQLLTDKLAAQAKGSLHPAQYAAYHALLLQLAAPILQWAQGASGILAEEPIERMWPSEHAAPIQIQGRVDQMWTYPQNEQDERPVRIFDFKTASNATLEERAKAPWNYPQLLLYAWIATNQHNVLESAFVSLTQGGIKPIPLRGDLTQLIDEIDQTLTYAFAGLQAGRPLPAHGSAQACQYCDAAGVCRKGQWSETNPAMYVA